MSTHEHPDQISLDGIPNKRGRPQTSHALTPAERQKRYRLNKKKKDQIELRRFISEKSAFDLETLEKKGMSLEQLIEWGMTTKFGSKKSEY